MPRGPAGAPRPLAKAEIVVYSRFAMGGGVHGEETEPLQTDPRFARDFAAIIDRLEGMDFTGSEVDFHPAGFIVGVEVHTGMDAVGRETINLIVNASQNYLEDVLNAAARLEKPNRKEEAVQVRAR